MEHPRTLRRINGVGVLQNVMRIVADVEVIRRVYRDCVDECSSAKSDALDGIGRPVGIGGKDGDAVARYARRRSGRQRRVRMRGPSVIGINRYEKVALRVCRDARKDGL